MPVSASTSTPWATRLLPHDTHFVGVPWPSQYFHLAPMWLNATRSELCARSADSMPPMMSRYPMVRFRGLTFAPAALPAAAPAVAAALPSAPPIGPMPVPARRLGAPAVVRYGAPRPEAYDAPGAFGSP